MKKTMAMISALAITASLVMPFTAVADDTLAVTQVAYNDVKDFTTIQDLADFLGLTADGTKPQEQKVQPSPDKTSGTVMVPYKYTETDIYVVYYGYHNGEWGYGGSMDCGLGTIKSAANNGDLYIPASTDKTLDKDKTSDTTQVEYTVDPSYTVTIPASVTLSSSATVEKTIKAESVKLAKGQNVVVTLTGAKNGETDDTPGTDKKFSAKTADGSSTAKYTISAGTPLTAITLGDTVATFVTDAEYTFPQDKNYQESTLTFSAASGATFAGDHTETLTFTLSTAAAVSTITVDGLELVGKDGDSWATIAQNNSTTIQVDNGYIKSAKGYLTGSAPGGDVGDVTTSMTYNATHNYEWMPLI